MFVPDLNASRVRANPTSYNSGIFVGGPKGTEVMQVGSGEAEGELDATAKIAAAYQLATTGWPINANPATKYGKPTTAKKTAAPIRS
jgi:hypothetical protein